MDSRGVTSWFAIHAKTRREDFVATNLGALDLEVFLPKLIVEQTAQETVREVCKPLFPGYLFGRFCPQVSLEAVNSCHGVLQVVSSGRFPIAIDTAIIQEIRSRTEADGFIRLRREGLRPGDRVAIKQGPLLGMMGRVERETDDRKRVAVLLETLWGARVFVAEHCLEASKA